MAKPDLIVENRGPLIVRTNFWSLPRMDGKAVVSINAGVYRVLLPKSRAGELAEMSTAKECVVSHVRWPARDRGEAMEILFDDGSRAPFAIFAEVEESDQRPGWTVEGRVYTLTVWTEAAGAPTLVLERPCRFRIVASLPCLDRWRG